MKRHALQCLAVAMVAFTENWVWAQPQPGGYVGMGTPPPEVSGGSITIYNRGPVPISFQLSGEDCAAQNFTIEPHTTTKYSCGSSGKMTSVFISRDKYGVIQTRKQKFRTGLHYFIAVDDIGALLLGTSSPGAFLGN